MKIILFHGHSHYSLYLNCYINSIHLVGGFHYAEAGVASDIITYKHFKRIMKLCFLVCSPDSKELKITIVFLIDLIYFSQVCIFKLFEYI